MSEPRKGSSSTVESRSSARGPRRPDERLGIVHTDATDGEHVLWDGPGRLVQVVVAAESSLLAEGLSALLHERDEVAVTVTTDHGQLQQRLAEGPVDVLLLEAAIVENRPRIVTELVATDARPRVLLLVDPRGVDRALPLLAAGAHGYVRTDADVRLIRHAIHAVAAGAAVIDPVFARVAASYCGELVSDRYDQLDDDQIALWCDIARGATLSDIAATHFVSERTARRRVALLLTDLGVENRSQAAELAGRLHLLDQRGAATTAPAAAEGRER